jgi:hypothetical protein
LSDRVGRSSVIFRIAFDIHLVWIGAGTYNYNYKLIAFIISGLWSNESIVTPEFLGEIANSAEDRDRSNRTISLGSFASHRQNLIEFVGVRKRYSVSASYEVQSNFQKSISNQIENKKMYLMTAGSAVSTSIDDREIFSGASHFLFSDREKKIKSGMLP